MTSLTFLKYSAGGFGEDEPAVAGASQVTTVVLVSVELDNETASCDEDCTVARQVVARQMQSVAGYRTLRRQVDTLQ